MVAITKPARRMTSISEPAAGASGPSNVATTVYSVVSTRGNMASTISVTVALSNRALAFTNGTMVAKSHTKPTIINGQNLILTIAFIHRPSTTPPLSVRHFSPRTSMLHLSYPTSKGQSSCHAHPVPIGAAETYDGDRRNCPRQRKSDRFRVIEEERLLAHLSHARRRFRLRWSRIHESRKGDTGYF